jgi:hypothetical protein
MKMFLVKMPGINLLVEDLETLELVKRNLDDIDSLTPMTIDALRNSNDKSYSLRLDDKMEKVKAKLKGKFFAGSPFHAIRGEAYARKNNISYTKVDGFM